MDKIKEIKRLVINAFAREVMEFIDDSPSVYHVVKNCSEILSENGFTKLELSEKWDLKEGGKYFTKRSDSAIIAFTVGEKIDENSGFKILGSHTDSPGFRIKPNSFIQNGNILRLNTEVYGGPILNTWFDRPLSIAGRVVVKSENIFKPNTICIKIDEPILTIPNLAIHQNREVNNGVKINRQKDVLPIFALINKKLENDNYLLEYIAKNCGIEKEDILDFDLYLYATEKGSFVGEDKELVSAPKIDNLVSVYSGLIGLVDSKNNSNRINVFVGFDNEEIGSTTKQGADSNYLSNVLERIVLSLGHKRENFLQMLYNSFMLSVDGAHAVHPAFTEKSDPTNIVELNKGVVVKISANQRYTSDAYSISVLKNIVEGENINVQYFVNNSNEVGGSTIGPISSSHLDIDSIDIGVPMLAMHSVRELCGVIDLFYLKLISKKFFEKN